MKKYDFIIETNGISTKEVCNLLNKTLGKKFEINCYNFDGAKVYIKTNESIKHLKAKIEKECDIQISNLFEVPEN